MSETSEQRYGLPKQPPDTCPMIEEVLKSVDDLRPEFEGVDRLTRWLRQFALDRAAQEPYRVAI